MVWLKTWSIAGVGVVLLCLVISVYATELVITTEPIPGVPLFPAEVAPAENLAVTNSGPAILAAPNLTPYKPSGWSDKVVVNSVFPSTMSTVTEGAVYAGQPSYISWAVINNGTANIPPFIRFYCYLYINSNFTTGWYTDGLLQNYYVYATGYQYIFTNSGTNAIQITADVTGAVTESDESDNNYSRNVNVNPGIPAEPDIRINPTKLDFNLTSLMESFIPSSELTDNPDPNVVDTSSPKGQLAPLNPAFIRYRENLASGKLQRLTKSGFPLGHIPAPRDLSYLKDIPASSEAAFALPVAYDCRTANKVTAVRDQGNAGSCWAHATYGSLESCLLPGELWDFSENNMKNMLSSAYPEGFDRAHDEGGNCFMATAYLSRWSGPISESDDPYNPYSGTSPVGLTVRKHIQNVIYPTSRTSATDNTTLKQAILNYGGVDSGIYYDDAYYNSTTYSYYYNGSENENHDITIVGWDDNYPASNFNPAAPGNGAFLIKNSWGTDWGQNGYFYMSYYDSKIGKTNAQFRYAESTTNYNKVYSYDPLGWINSYGFGTTVGWFANVFTAGGSEELTAVSWYTPVPSTPYELRIYQNPNSGPINSSGAVFTKTGTIAEPGYVTIALGTTISLTAGQKFSAVVKLTTPGYNYPIPIEYPEPGYSTKAKGGPGESYISSNGSSWSDISSAFMPKSNVCLKAFTKTTSLSGTTQSFTVYNDGFSILTVTNITKTNNKSWITSISPTAFTVPPSGTQTVNVTVSASGLTVAKDTEVLKIWSNDPDENPYSGPTVTITGRPQAPVNSYGYFSTASDTSRWYFEVYGDGTGPGTLSWLPGFSGQTGVVRIIQTPGQKGKLTMLFSVSSAGWYTARAKVATDITNSAKQPKIYLYLQELTGSSTIIGCANEVIAAGAGGFSAASSWKNLEISYYASGTSLAVQVVSINSGNSGVIGGIYFDDILVYASAPKGYNGTTASLTNASFTSNTSGWSVQVYGDATAMGTWSWATGWYGRSGLMKGTQSSGQKAKVSQLFALPNGSNKNAFVSIWVFSGATAKSNTQKVYLYLYSWDSGYTKIIESGNAILYPGQWNQNQWRELKFGYTPYSGTNALQFVAINPSGKPVQTIYFDAVTVKQE
ncbi:MAG: lectin like domain-containing protein [bacterium]|nr:lectin like domain-containing protein [bacterium]